jgi:hypothetical protein
VPAARSDAAGDRALAAALQQELDAAGAPAAAGAVARRVRNRTSKHECGCCFDEVALPPGGEAIFTHPCTFLIESH